MTSVAIHIVSDTICPWCYIGKRRLEKALTLLDNVSVSVHWRPYLLDKTIPEGGMDRQTYLTRKFGAERAKQVYERIGLAGEAEGIAFGFERIAKTPNTIDSHRVLHWAEASGVQNALAERLFQLYFIEGGDIGDHAILADAAAACGMDRAVIAARLASDDARSHVLKDIAEANEIGIDGVPCFVFNGHIYLPGAQPPEVLADTIRKAAA